MVREGESLSDFWRVHISQDKAIEQKNILESMTTLIGNVARQHGKDVQVVYACPEEGSNVTISPEGKGTRIALDVLPINNIPAPFAGDRVDVVVGHAMHEAGHLIYPNQTKPADKEKLIRTICRTRNAGRQRYDQAYWDHWTFESQHPEEKSVIDNIANILDDIVVDTRLSQEAPALNAYINCARDFYLEHKLKDHYELVKARLRDGRLSQNDLLELWTGTALYKQPIPDDIPPEAITLLAKMLVESGKLLKGKPVAKILSNVRSVIEGLPIHPPPPSPPPALQSQPQPEQEQKEEGEEEEKKDEERESQEDDQDSGAGSTGEEQEGDDKESASDEGKEGKEEDEEVGDDEQGDGGSDEESPEGKEEEEGEEGEASEDKDGEGEESGDQPADSDEEGNEEGETEAGSSMSGKPQVGEPEETDSKDEFNLANVMNQPLESLSEAEVQELLKAIEDQREDITDQSDLNSAGVTDDTRIILQRGGYDEAEDHRLSAAVTTEANSLSYIFDRWQRRQTRYSRGKDTGRLDQSLLHRGGLHDNHVFKLKESIKDMDMAMCILVDISSSVSLEQWDVFKHIAATFGRGMGARRDVDLITLAYRGGMNGIEIFRMWDTTDRMLRLGGVSPHGGTPTGEAIMAVKNVILPRYSRRKDKIIIHVTDGGPNEPDVAAEAVKQCLAEGILVGAIVIGDERDTLTYRYTGNRVGLVALCDQVYGNLYQLIQGWQDLSEALEDLIKRILGG